jgi:hypothetical protein
MSRGFLLACTALHSYGPNWPVHLGAGFALVWVANFSWASAEEFALPSARYAATVGRKMRLGNGSTPKPVAAVVTFPIDRMRSPGLGRSQRGRVPILFREKRAQVGQPRLVCIVRLTARVKESKFRL